MRLDWLQAATDAIRRNDHRNTLAGAVASLGAALAIGGMDWLSVASHYPLVIIPFATPNNLPWSFLFAPVLAGAMLLTAFANVWHRWLRQRRWPQRWL
jgi:CBS-domain-containing membrane protein